MKIDLVGRTAFISGSSQGIGLAIATVLARSGARVVIKGRSRSALAEWLRYVEVNVLSTIRFIRTHLPAVIESGWGRVQNICSDSVWSYPRR